MKEQIFNALKTAILVRGKTSVSDATINLYVELIDSEKITNEQQISDIIKPYVRLLQATQANINNVVARAISTKESELKRVIEKLNKANSRINKEKEVLEWEELILNFYMDTQLIITLLKLQMNARTYKTLSKKKNNILR